MEIEATPRKLGACAACDTPVHRVTRQVPLDHPTRAGEPLAFGGRLSSRLWTCVLMDGRVATLSLCLDCAAALGPEDFPALWRRTLLATVQECDDARRAETAGLHGVEDACPRDEALRWAHLAGWLQLRRAPLLGVLSVQEIS